MRSSVLCRGAVLVGASALLVPACLGAQRPGAARTAEAPADSAAVTKLPPGPRAMMLGDWYRVVNVSAPAVSPDAGGSP
ncbi:MAG TPA: hypothetical protein VEA99_13770 [Gemmatimonadaceae bacterium]|nr:hypothetical protein [Gemmatimonadaceae bacterium]